MQEQIYIGLYVQINKYQVTLAAVRETDDKCFRWCVGGILLSTYVFTQ